MKKLWVVLILIVVLVFASFHLSFFKSSPIKSVQIGNTVLDKIEIANTDIERKQGLSGREGLEPNETMLFVFTRSGYYSFWMKDMKFSIDMIWLDRNGIVVGLEKSMKPDSYPQTFDSQSKAKYVLETRAGLAEKESLKLGSRVVFGY